MWSNALVVVHLVEQYGAGGSPPTLKNTHSVAITRAQAISAQVKVTWCSICRCSGPPIHLARWAFAAGMLEVRGVVNAFVVAQLVA